MGKRVHLIVVRDGEYEDKRWYALSAFERRRDAVDRADELNELSRSFQREKREFKEPPDLTGTDEEYDREYTKWSAERDAMVSKWRKRMKLPALDHYDEPSFSVTSVPLHTTQSTKERA